MWTADTNTPRRHVLFVAGIILASAAAPAAADDVPSGDDAAFPPGEKEAMGAHVGDLNSIEFRPGKGLAVASQDGDFELVTRLRLQELLTVASAPDEDTSLGLMLRRARLQFLGNVFGEHNRFKSEFAFSPRDLRMTTLDDGTTVTRESPLLSWYLEFDYLRDLTLRTGQYKIPFSRQRVISSGNLQMVDRSSANGEFNLDRDIGFDVRSKDLLGLGFLRYYAGIYNGEGRSAFSVGNTDLMYLARVEVLPLGMYKDYSEADFQRLAAPGLSIGLAYAYAPNATGTEVNRGGAPADGGTTDVQTVAADVNLKWMGASLSSEFFYRDASRNPGGAVDDMGNPIPTEAPRKGLGWFLQSGYLLPGMPLEIAGRYGEVRGRGNTILGTEHELGLAVSYYFAQHPFKLQADTFQLWGPSFSDGVTRGRVQAQVAF